MRKILFLTLLISPTALAQPISGEVKQLKSEITTLRNQSAKLQKDVLTLTSQGEQAAQEIDSLRGNVAGLRDSTIALHNQLKGELKQTNEVVATNEAALSSEIEQKAIIGLAALLVIIALGAVIAIVLKKKMAKNGSALSEVKKAQAQLASAQKKLEEESVKVDNRLIELLQQKMDNASQAAAPTDHSLVLKIADEITRIALNLSRMDPATRGYKQLTRGVERIKNNFLAKGYEITDMLGKPYDEGMRVNADFVIDESLAPGTQIISSITKPQVIYNGNIIQKATITVSQNI